MWGIDWAAKRKMKPEELDGGLDSVKKSKMGTFELPLRYWHCD